MNPSSTKATEQHVSIASKAADELGKPLANRDVKDIERILDRIAIAPDVNAIAVYDSRGAFVTGYRAATQPVALDELMKEPLQRSGEHMFVTRLVVQSSDDTMTQVPTPTRLGALWIDFSSGD